MFPSTDDLVALNSQVMERQRGINHQERVIAELRRLDEPTALAEKFLFRLRTKLVERQKHLGNLMRDAASELHE